MLERTRLLARKGAKLNIRRLTMLAEMCDAIEAGKAKDVLKPIEVNDKILDVPKHLNMEEWHCGTSACVAGHAMFHPAFNAEGFGPGSYWTDLVRPSYDKNSTWFSLTKFFEIDFANSLRIFSNDEYDTSDGQPVTAAEVAARIREMIAADGADKK